MLKSLKKIALKTAKNVVKMVRNILKTAVKHPKMAPKPCSIPGISEGKKLKKKQVEKNPREIQLKMAQNPCTKNLVGWIKWKIFIRLPQKKKNPTFLLHPLIQQFHSHRERWKGWFFFFLTRFWIHLQIRKTRKFGTRLEGKQIPK